MIGCAAPKLFDRVKYLMVSSEPTRPRRMPYIVRVIRTRPRLFLSAACGAAVVAALPAAAFRFPTRLLIGWDVGVAAYLLLAYYMIAHSDVARIKRRAATQDEGRFIILILTAGAALASLGAILAELGSGGRQPPNLALASLTIVLSWAFTHTMFALHYAHDFYDRPGRAGDGLTFPGNEKPDYWDFVYFSLVIGMTSQVSDVAVACKTIRRTVAAHGVISFFFNAALLALLVNIAASAL
jgi:uncharacterized membrane protein